MARVCVFNSPLYGHVYPTLALVEELVRRGDQVTYYLTQEFAELVHATGATFREYSSSWQQQSVLSDRLSRLEVQECRQVLPQVFDEIQAAPPDYIIYENICLWGRLLAHSLQIPTVKCSVMVASNEHFMLLPDASLADLARLVEHTLNDLQTLDELCRTYHLPPMDHLDFHSLFLHAEDLNIVFLPRLFQPAGETFDERFVFVGPCLSKRKEISQELRTQFLSSSSLPLLYVSLGTLFNARADVFARQCFQALGDQPWRVLLALGSQVDRASLPSIPSNFQVHTYVPQLDVLAHSTLFITHGGANSVMEALSYGVPMVVIPQTPEHKVYAQRVAELGLGVQIAPEEVKPSRLREAVKTVAENPSHRERLQQLQPVLRAAGGTQRAADAIMQWLARQT